MKTQNAVWKKILKVSLAGTFAATPLLMGASAAQAAPPRHAPAYGYRDKDHKNDKDKQFDLRVGGTTYNVYASSRLPNGISQNDSVRVYGERYGNNDIRNANVSLISNRSNNRWDNKRNDNNNRWDNNKNSNNNSRWNNYQKFTGKVSNVKGQQFDLRVGNTVYNVYASSRLPNNINQGDVVRVYGERYGNNDIRNANVSIISNNSRWDNNRNDNNNRWNNYQTFTGTVTNVKSSSEFDVRIGSDTYNVYTSGNNERRVSKNDVVRIYGQRHGNNDIRNANVVVIRNR